jgi:hypothetical protein
MNFRPKQYYVTKRNEAAVEAADNTLNVYFRKNLTELGHIKVGNCASHKEAILAVKEALVAEGDGLHNKAVLVAIKGGKIAN